jgi:hypothetical protein
MYNSLMSSKQVKFKYIKNPNQKVVDKLVKDLKPALIKLAEK